MVELNDRLFLALAKKAGVPAKKALRHCQEVQGERTLFATAVEEGQLPPEQAKKFERWAKQVKHGDLSPLEGSPAGDSAAAQSVSGEGKSKSSGSGEAKIKKSGASAKVAAHGKAASAAKVATASAGKVATASPGKVAAKRRAIRQSSATLASVPLACKLCAAELDDRAVAEARAREVDGHLECETCSPASPAVAESPVSANEVSGSEVSESKDEATDDTPAHPEAPRSNRAPIPAVSSRKPQAGTPSAAAPAVKAPSSKGLLVVAVSALVASAFIGAAVAVSFRNKATAVATADPAKTSSTPKGARKASGGPVEVKFSDAGKARSAAARAAELDEDRVPHTLKTAEELERDGKEDEAVITLDAVLEMTTNEDARQPLVDAKNRLVSRLRDQIDRVKSLTAAGKRDEAKKLLGSLRGHYPDMLTPDLDEAERSLAAKQKPADAASDPASDAGKADAGKLDAGKADPGKAAALDPKAKRAAELERFAKTRAGVTKALSELDVLMAKGALDAGGVFEEKETTLGVILDHKRIDAISKLLVYGAAGCKSLVGTNVDLELREGAHFAGKLTRVDGDKLVVTTAAGDLETALQTLSTEAILRVALAGASTDADLEPYFFARGVLLACTGDRKGATEALALAPSVAEAALLKAGLDSNDPTLAAAPKRSTGAPGTTGDKPKDPGPVAAAPDDPDGPSKPRPKTWMDDVEGGIPWEQAYTFETTHYVIKTNVKKEYAKRWGKIMEALAERYTRIFGFEGNDFRYRKNELWLYKNQEEFMQYENMSPNVGGFYNPGDKRLHTFHGPWKGAEEATTLSILAHEAVHQFQNLVLRNMEHAPTFIIEGLSSFAEGTIVRPDGDVIVGPISEMRLKTMRRAFKANKFIHLKELIRTSHAEFSGFHYAHTWGLIHWCFFGPEAKKAQIVLDAYWKICLERQATAKDWEDLCLQMGYSMEKLEKAWKDWIMSLDVNHDPAIEYYEKKTGKKAGGNQ